MNTKLQFSKFLFVGIIWTIVNIVLLWLLIDVLGLAGWLGSSIVVFSALIGRYYHYVFLKVIKPHFMKFLGTNFVFSLLTVVFMSLFVDFLHIPAKFSSPLVIGGLFIGKFITFKFIGLLED